MDNYEDIIALFEADPPIQPSPDFTEQVMQNLTSARKIPFAKLRAKLVQPRRIHFVERFSDVPGAESCSFAFMMVGFFYFVLGAALLAWFAHVGETAVEADWIGWQLMLAFTAAVLLFAIGLLLLTGKKIFTKAAYVCLFAYFGYVILNGAALFSTLNVPAARIGVFFVGGICLLLGGVLWGPLWKYRDAISVA